MSLTFKAELITAPLDAVHESAESAANKRGLNIEGKLPFDTKTIVRNGKITIVLLPKPWISRLAELSD